MKFTLGTKVLITPDADKHAVIQSAANGQPGIVVGRAEFSKDQTQPDTWDLTADAGKDAYFVVYRPKDANHNFTHWFFESELAPAN